MGPAVPEAAAPLGDLAGGDTSNCGACTVVLDGASVKSCRLLAAQADGGEVTSACARDAG